MLTDDGEGDDRFHHGATEDTEDGGHHVNGTATATAFNAEYAEYDNG